MNTTTAKRAGTIALVGIALVGVAVPAVAGGGVEREGNCSARSDWKLKASPDDGRIEVRGIVDSDVGGQRWRWKMLHNGSVSARGRATTESGSGEFRVRRLMVNVPGDDRIGWRAKNRRTGEVCRGNLTF
ncbi:MAG TPA: hypothetical protein VFX15_07345 [Actinomycetes bacterium]|nr:hypothetical protein [Actinomycetes bacterium]